MGLGLDGRDAGEACLLALLAQLLLAGEGEDAVGFLGQLDRAETREDRDEVDRRDQRVHVAAAEERPRRDPVEDRGAAGEGEPGQERAPGSADAERHREREPDEPGKHRGGRVGERERVHAEQRATDAGDRGRQGEHHDLRPVHSDARRLGRHLRAAHRERGAARRGVLHRVDDQRQQAEHDEEQQDLFLQHREVELRKVRNVARPLELVHEEVVHPVDAGDVERRGADRPAALAVADVVDRERHEREEERPRQRAEREVDASQSGQRQREQRAERGRGQARRSPPPRRS